MTKHSVSIFVLIAAAAAALFGVTCVHSYNRLVTRDQDVTAQWAQVENDYQRRADLVPNLVETVRGASAFERETLERVTEARSRLGQAKLPAEALTDPEKFRAYQAAQDQLGGALGHLIAVAEQYPQLTATQGYRDLQAQLEGTENRIAVARMRFNEAARDYNTARATFPTTLVAHLFGRFAEHPYFAATPGAAEPPKVKF